jgi:hypothetical protein
MKTRWRFWLLPLLTVGLLLSVFEVNTDDIVNTWGDAYDAYLPPAFWADSSSSVTISPIQRKPTGVLPIPVRWPSGRFVAGLFPAPGGNRPGFLHRSRIHLRCCQWLI